MDILWLWKTEAHSRSCRGTTQSCQGSVVRPTRGRRIEGGLLGGISTQLQPSFVPRFSIAVQPPFRNWTDEETMRGYMQVLGRSMLESIGSI